MPIGSLIKGGLSLLGGSINAAAQKKANDQNTLAAQQANETARLENRMAVRIRTADSLAAGIHPLFGLGASVGGSFSPVVNQVGAVTGMGDAMHRAGQDLGRAANVGLSLASRVNQQMQALSLQRMGLENQLLASQIAKINQPGSPPPSPARTDNYLIGGQTSSGLQSLVKDTPLERVVSAPGQPQSEPGAIPDVGYARTKTGYAPVPSETVKQRIEDNIIQEVLWAVRNNVLPTFGFNQSPPASKPPEGYRWHFNRARQEYQLRRSPTRRELMSNPRRWLMR